MSEIATVTTEFTNLQALKEAALELKLTVLEQHSAKTYFGDDNKKHALVLRKEGMYDVAVDMLPNGKLSLSTDWHAGRTEAVVGKDYAKLKQPYGVSLAMHELRRQRFGGMIRKTTSANGNVLLRVGL